MSAAGGGGTAHPSRRYTHTIALLGAPGAGMQRLARLLRPHLLSRGYRVVHAASRLPRRTVDRVLLVPQASPTSQGERHEAALRKALTTLAIGFAVVHGPTPAAQRTQALNAIFSIAKKPIPSRGRRPKRSSSRARRPWQCDCCADPESERRLFQRLLNQRPD